MKRINNQYILYFAVFLSILISPCLKAQSDAIIENIDFYAEGNSLVIKYDIVKANKSELFEIWVKVSTESGKTIIPKSMNGDAGTGISGGANKRIVWDLDADEVTITEAFSIEVFAQSDYKAPPKVVKEKKEGISVGASLLLSAVLPGLGKTVAKGRGGQWMWGVVGYGCVIGSVSLNKKANNAYEDYKNSTDPDERDELFSQAEENDLYSKILIGTAATIWFIDLISTATQVGKIRKRNNSKYSINYNIDPYTGKPLVGVTFRF